MRHLHCVEGHLHSITTMVEHGADCQSVVQQIVAVQGALRQVAGLVVKHHLSVCVDGQLQNQDVTVRQHCLAEVVSLYQLLGGSSPPMRRKEKLVDIGPTRYTFLDERR